MIVNESICHRFCLICRKCESRGNKKIAKNCMQHKCFKVEYAKLLDVQLREKFNLNKQLRELLPGQIETKEEDPEEFQIVTPEKKAKLKPKEYKISPFMSPIEEDSEKEEERSEQRTSAQKTNDTSNRRSTSMSPRKKQEYWTEKEDNLLKHLVNKHGKGNWRCIAQAFESKTH